MNLLKRVAQIQFDEDINTQVSRAKDYLLRLRRLSKKQDTLSEKLATNEKIKAAESTLRQLRRLVFDIEDALKAGLPATSVLSKNCNKAA